jgi:hypothetical protein
MPLWQSMQVSLFFTASSCDFLARGFCFSTSMLLSVWQLRHSSESLAFMRAHSFSASCSRLASNFSRVSIEPMALP